MFMHKLPNSSHTNTDITPLLCSLGLNIYLLQFVLLHQGGAGTAFPQPPREKLLPSQGFNIPRRVWRQLLPLGHQ